MSHRLLQRIVAPMIALILVLGGAVYASADNHEGDELNEAIAQLSPEQKAALLVLVNGIVAAKTPAASAVSDPQPPAPAVSPEEGAMKTVKAYVKAAEEGDIEGLVGCFSDSFDHYELGDKNGLKAFIEGVEAEGMLEDISGNTDEAEAEVDGDTVTVYPVELEGLFGTVTYEFELKEEGGEWKIVAFDMTGV